MKNKGFSLIELLTTIVLIGVLAGICTPIIITAINDSKEKSYERQKEMIEKAAERYVSENALEFSGDKLTISFLKTKGYLKDDKIKNPKNPSEEMNGCVYVIINDKKSSYQYRETC